PTQNPDELFDGFGREFLVLGSFEKVRRLAWVEGLPDPQRTGLVDRLSTPREACHRIRGFASTLDQESPCSILGCHDGRFQGLDEARYRSEIILTLSGSVPRARHSVDASGRLVLERMPADTSIVPIGDEHRAIRSGRDIHRSEPG